LDNSKQSRKESIITLDNSEDVENLRNEAQRSKCGADKSRLLLEERLNLSRIENLNNSTESDSSTETKKRLASSNSTVEKIDPSNLKRNNNREGIIDQNINDQGTSASFATVQVFSSHVMMNLWIQATNQVYFQIQKIIHQKL